MAISHIAVLATVLVAMLCLPCAVAVVVCADELAARRFLTRRGRQETHALRSLDRCLAAWDPAPVTQEPELHLGELEADLRRLDRQRRSSPTTHSTAWLAAVLRAYDQRLVLASQRLGFNEHLDQLDGMDREIERLRVEELLHAAGLRLRAS